MVAHGYRKRLLRKNLIIERKQFDGPGRFGKFRGSPEKLSFRRHDWLDEWADRRDKGEQKIQHSTRLPPELRMRLMLSPGVRSSFNFLDSSQAVLDAALRDGGL